MLPIPFFELWGLKGGGRGVKGGGGGGGDDDIE